MLVGRWHHRLPPLPGELLTSCLARNALAHGTSPTRFLSLFWPREHPWSTDLDRDLAGLIPRNKERGAKDWPDLLAEAMGLPRDAILDATLDAYRARLTGGAPNARGATPLLLSAGLAARERKRHALQFCPDCLGEGVPHFRRECAWPSPSPACATDAPWRTPAPGAARRRCRTGPRRRASPIATAAFGRWPARSAPGCRPTSQRRS